MVCATPRPGMIVTLGRAGRSVCFGMPRSLQYEFRHRFNVIRVREDVDRLDAREAVAARHEIASITCQGRGIAGYVDHATRSPGNQLRHDLGRARPGWAQAEC